MAGSRKNTMESMEDVINGLPEQVLKNLASSRNKDRKRAFETISETISHLDGATDATESLPLALIKMDKVVGAVGFILEAGKKGFRYSPDTLREMFENACGQIPNEIEEGDKETEQFKQLISSHVGQIIREQSKLSDSFEMETLVADYYYLFKKDYKKAIVHYSKWIENNHPAAIISAAEAYLEEWEFLQSVFLFEKCWYLTGNIDCIARLIHAHFRQGNVPEAYKWYERMASVARNQKFDVFPIVYYKGSIENDYDLHELDDVVSTFLLNPLQSTSAKELFQSAQRYLDSKIEAFSNEIADIEENSDEDTWGIKEQENMERLVFERFFYIERSVFLLLDAQWLDVYIHDVQDFLSDVENRGLLFSYLEENPMATLYIGNKLSGDAPQQGRDDFDEEGIISDDEERGSPLEHLLRNRLSFIILNFRDPQDIPHLRDIQELARSSMQSSPSIVEKADAAVESIKLRETKIRQLGTWFGEFYDDLIVDIDNKDTELFRRHIEFYSRILDLWGAISSFPRVFQKESIYPAFFIMEKLLVEWATIREKDIVRFFETFEMTELDPNDTYLLAACLMQSGFPEIAIRHILITWNLHEGHFLELLFDAYHMLDSSVRADIKEEIKEKIRCDFEISLGEHVENLCSVAYDRDEDDEKNSADAILGMFALMERDLPSAERHFSEAHGRNDIKGHVEYVGVLEMRGEYQQALNENLKLLPLIEKEHDQKKRTLERILSLSASLGDFHTYSKYLVAAREESLDTRISAFVLGLQGSFESQYQSLLMYAKNPEGYELSSGEQTIAQRYISLHSTYNSFDGKEFSLKSFVLCSYLRYKLVQDFDSVLHHWEDIDMLTTHLDDVDWVMKLRDTFRDIVPYDEELESEFHNKPVDLLLSILQNHALTFRIAFTEVIRKAQATDCVFLYINIYSSFILKIISILQKFPDTQDVIKGWNTELVRMNNCYVIAPDSGSLIMRNESVIMN